MKLILTLLMILYIVTGCSGSTNDRIDSLKWFKTENIAIDYGMKEEKITKENVIGKIKKNGETFIFYKKNLPDGLGLGIASISEKNGQYAWYKVDQDILVKKNDNEAYSPEINWDTKTQSGKSFTVYTGITKDQNISIKTPKGIVKPDIIDKNSGIYFYIESTKAL